MTLAVTVEQLIGNSMAVNCMEWIGERIAAFEEKRPSRMVDVVLRRS